MTFSKPKQRGNDTSWQPVHRWYNKSVGQKGSFFHQEVILPQALKLLDLKPTDSFLDLACGQGILERHIPKQMPYLGLDLSTGLIESARKQTRSQSHEFKVVNVAKKFSQNKKFTKAAIILGLQNLENPLQLFQNAADHLSPGGLFLIVINHPYFRIPRQTSWHVDPKNKLQSRLVNHYLSPLKIPINMNPSHGSSGSLTWSFHFSLQDYSKFLGEAGFKILKIEEWTSPKQSQGKFKKMEDHSRDEFPLFMALLVQRN